MLPPMRCQATGPRAIAAWLTLEEGTMNATGETPTFSHALPFLILHTQTLSLNSNTDPNHVLTQSSTNNGWW